MQKREKIIYREATILDVNDISDLEKRVWGDNAATLKNINNRISTFAKGNVVAVRKSDKKVVGYVSTVIINKNKANNYRTWYDYTDNGNAVSVFDPSGELLFGTSLTVDTSARNSGIGSMLLINIGRMAIENNLEAGILGGRLPFYHTKKTLSVEEYANLKDEKGRIFDPELRLYTRMGLKVVNLESEYFNDPESLNYGVILRWNNPFYGITKHVPILCKPLSYLFRI